MCGIAGYFDLQTPGPPDLARVKAMADALVHRGPDGEGFHAVAGIGLGHRRLAIIDLHTGQQPVFNEDRQIAVVFNGEIYNYVELRQELQARGHSFATESDTEAIVHAYEEWGEEAATRFNGMWAFALWDSRERSLLLSRDRLGEKPLYYAFDSTRLLFGSEIKALLAGGWPRRPRLEMSELYLRLSYLPAPHTFYEGIHQLEPGCSLVVRRGRVSQRRYWRCAWRAEEDMRRDARPVAAEFGALLCDSVRLRMRSDVPFGAFLSGGLDSGSVVALMAEMSGFPVETFTIGYAENAYDERALARQVAARYQTRHHEEVVAADRLDESLTEVLRHYDEPFGDPSAMPVGVVSKLARRSVKMVLTGDGGDEVLSGYTAYQGERVSDAIRRWPRWVAEGASQVGQSLRPFLRGGARLEAGRWTYLLQTAHGSFVDRLAAKASRGHDRDVLALVRSAIPGIVRLEDYLSEFFGACPFASPFYRLMYFHLLCSLPHDMLTKVDRMSMAHSLETRTPFLDYRLVEMMAGVDQRVKMPALKRKAVLRRAMRTRLPAALWRARKRGFSVPLRDWFGDPSWEDRIGELQPLRQIGVTEACIRSLYGAHRAHISDNGRLLWALWILSRWLGR